MRSVLRAASTTRAPTPDRTRAKRSPNPELAPVTTTTRSSSRKLSRAEAGGGLGLLSAEVTAASLRGAGGDDPTGVQLDDPISYPGRLLRVMGDQEGGWAVVGSQEAVYP